MEPFILIVPFVSYIYLGELVLGSSNLVLYILFIVKGGLPLKVDYNYWILIIFKVYFIATLVKKW